jgi:hypothetical protein
MAHHTTHTASNTYDFLLRDLPNGQIKECTVQRTSHCENCARRKEATFYLMADDATFLDIHLDVNPDDVVVVVNYMLENDVFSLHHLRLTLAM